MTRYEKLKGSWSMLHGDKGIDLRITGLDVREHHKRYFSRYSRKNEYLMLEVLDDLRWA